MAAVTLEIDNLTPRSRVTTFFRSLLVIPQMIVVYVLQMVAQLLTVVQWFIILFTGKRNEGIWNFVAGVLNWQTRVITYAYLMYDKYPAFAFEGAGEPVRLGMQYEESANRLTNALRIFWIIPAAILGMFIALALAVYTLISWFIIVITAKHPSGIFDFSLKAHQYMARLNAYALLLTDTYPSLS